MVTDWSPSVIPDDLSLSIQQIRERSLDTVWQQERARRRFTARNQTLQHLLVHVYPYFHVKRVPVCLPENARISR